MRSVISTRFFPIGRNGRVRRSQTVSSIRSLTDSGCSASISSTTNSGRDFDSGDNSLLSSGGVTHDGGRLRGRRWRRVAREPRKRPCLRPLRLSLRHCVFALDFSFCLVYILCISHERLSEPPNQTLRRRAQLPFPHCAAFLRSMVSSWHSLGTFWHLWQGQLPLCPRGTA